MGPSIISEIKRNIGLKSRFFSYTPAFDAPVNGSPSEYCHNVRYGKARTVWLLDGEKSLMMRLGISIQYSACAIQTDRQTDGQMDILPQHSPRLWRASCGKNCKLAKLLCFSGLRIFKTRSLYFLNLILFVFTSLPNKQSTKGIRFVVNI